jgi:hypothetical protein
MTLYKHGVGFFERRAAVSGEAVSLTFRVDEMNDILKSLTAIDWGPGQVLGVAYATPQSSEEQLAGCSIHLGDVRSLQDLLVSLRGRRIRLMLDQVEALTGILVGLDEAPDEEPMATALVSVLLDDSSWVQAVTLGRVQGLEILDERGISDLRFFLQTSLAQENYRQVSVRLTPGEHDLSISYVAPAPTWRVSYRLVLAEATEGPASPAEDASQSNLEQGALLQGWGIFDNRLEEDLEGISLALVAGMPISFIYELYTPFTPVRPEIREEARVAAGPVEFGAMVMEKGAMEGYALGEAAPELARGAPRMAAAAMAPPRGIRANALEAAAPAQATGAELGELFQYTIATPVTVGRGQSAMVPIISERVACRKDLLYNAAKMPIHPVATLRMQNETGLTLERGPATVLEPGQAGGGGAQYAGEAVLPFTAPGGEVVVPYAVELGVRLREEAGTRREMHGLRIEGHFLSFEEWDIRWRSYQANNSTARDLAVLVEHPRTAHYELFETPEPREQTADHLRFEVEVPRHGETTLRVQERRLVVRREEIKRQSASTLQGYLKRGWLSQEAHGQLQELLALWEQIAAHERRLVEIEKERQAVYQAQEQVRNNMQALSTSGKEGALRASYVDKLQASEKELEGLADEETGLKSEIERLNEEVEIKTRA